MPLDPYPSVRMHSPEDDPSDHYAEGYRAGAIALMVELEQRGHADRIAGTTPLDAELRHLEHELHNR